MVWQQGHISVLFTGMDMSIQDGGIHDDFDETMCDIFYTKSNIKKSVNSFEIHRINSFKCLEKELLFYLLIKWNVDKLQGP